MTLPAYAMNVSSFPQMFEQWLVGPLVRPCAEVLVEHARLRPSDRVLDIACGTGIVARLAKDRLRQQGRVVGVDVSPQMLAVARAVAPVIDWREGDASRLPLAEGEQFDVVLCQQGLQFFPDRIAAVAEMRRAIASGGRLLVAVWQSLDEAPFFRDAYRAAERRLGAFVDGRHSFGDPRALERLIGDAGFDTVSVESVKHTIRFADPAPFVRMNTMALVGMSPASSTLNDQERATPPRVKITSDRLFLRSQSERRTKRLWLERTGKMMWNRLRYTVWAPAYDVLIRAAGFEAARRVSIDQLRLAPTDRVLIVGAGTGLDLDLLPATVDVTAIDVTPAMLKQLEHRAAGAGRSVKTRIMDARQLAFPDSSFDAVVMHLILAVMPQPERGVSEAVRVLKPGGRIAVFDKFLSDDERPTLKRRFLNALAKPLFSDLNRQLGPLITGTPLVVEHDRPVAFGGTYRVVTLRKSGRGSDTGHYQA